MKKIFLLLLCVTHLFACVNVDVKDSESLSPFQQTAVETLDEAINTICDKHFDKEVKNIDWVTIREQYYPRVIKAKSIKELSNTLNSMVGSIGHSHVAVFPPEDPYKIKVLNAQLKGLPIPPPSPRKRNVFKQQKIPEGVPGTLGLRCAIVDDQLRIIKIEDKSPADNAGLKTGDIIVGVLKKGSIMTLSSLAIKSSPMTPWCLLFSIETSVKAGESVQLAINSKDSPFEPFKIYKMTTIPSHSKWVKMGAMPLSIAVLDSYMTKDNIGYLKLTPCLPDNIFAARRAIQQLKKAGMKGLIIDVRGNPGGLAQLSTALMGHLIDTQRVIVYTSSRVSQMPLIAFPQKDAFLGPVALLIDQSSCSSSEILAAGIKDNQRGKLYGKKTAGVCLGSNFIELKSGFRLQTVLINLERLNGEEIEAIGVAPDIESEQTLEDAIKGIDTTEALAHKDLLELIQAQSNK